MSAPVTVMDWRRGEARRQATRDANRRDTNICPCHTYDLMRQGKRRSLSLSPVPDLRRRFAHMLLSALKRNRVDSFYIFSSLPKRGSLFVPGSKATRENLCWCVWIMTVGSSSLRYCWKSVKSGLRYTAMCFIEEHRIYVNENIFVFIRYFDFCF